MRLLLRSFGLSHKTDIMNSGTSVILIKRIRIFSYHYPNYHPIIEFFFSGITPQIRFRIQNTAEQQSAENVAEGDCATL